jgi:cysteine desulfuration protein SufE
MKSNAIQDEIIDAFSQFDDWFDKYEYLVQVGQDLPPATSDLRMECNQIPGCQSVVWLRAKERDGKVYFSADSDAQITRGILALLLRVLSGQTQREITACELYFIQQTGLASHLSPSRANGLSSIVTQMKGRLIREVVRTQHHACKEA